MIRKSCLLRTMVFGFAAAVLTFPLTSSSARYVWRNENVVTLEIIYRDTILTGVFQQNTEEVGDSPADHASAAWKMELEHIDAVRQEDGFVLTAEPGYTLPEILYVFAGDSTYDIPTDGTVVQPGFIFDSSSSVLTIPEEFHISGISILSAAAEPADFEGSSDSISE